MSSESNKDRVRRAFEEFVHKGDLSNVAEYIAPDYGGHFAGLPPVSGVEGFKQFLTMQNAGFSDRQITFEDVIAEGDKVVARLTFRGTHTGELMGIPPTGKKVEYSAMNIFRIVGGKAVQQWAVLDNLTMMQQLGVIPAPQAT
jgi:predicted ester cyclase